MTIKDSFQQILGQFRSARTEPFRNHPIAKILRNILPNEFEKIVPLKSRFVVEGSAGIGGWNYCPWVATMDAQITETPQVGYYLTYLFKEDMTGVYLSLNQGVTDLKERWGKGAKDVLRKRASEYEVFLGQYKVGYEIGPIDLASIPSRDASYYEVGNIIAKYYSADKIPDDDQLKVDYLKMVSLYLMLNDGEKGSRYAFEIEDDEVDIAAEKEDFTKLRMHKRIERNRSLAQKVKKLQGYGCKACGFDFEKVYGEIGRKYIEAHHLVPIHTLKGLVVSNDPIKDFAVLCSNCHRMIHRSGKVGDIESFRKQIKKF